MKPNSLAAAVVVLFTLFSIPLGAVPVGTAFTYQGRLTDNGAPASGSYDLRASLFTADSGGAQVGAVVTVPAVPVSDGVFTAELDFGADAFNGEGRWLELSVRRVGVAEFTKLDPRQPIRGAPFAQFALTPAGPAGAEGLQGPAGPKGDKGDTGATGAGGEKGEKGDAGPTGPAGAQGPQGPAGAKGAAGLTGPQGPPGAAGAKGDQGDAGATGAAGAQGPQGPAGASGVPSGSLVLSDTDYNANLVNASYVKIGTIQGGDTWQLRNNGVILAARNGHTAIWTGSEMIIWGGHNGSSAEDSGARFNPAANLWTAVPASGVPRTGHSAVWTGSEMIVWGGSNSSGYLNDGGRFNPAENKWSPVTTTGAPMARAMSTAVWTGSDVIIWGGFDYDAFGFGGPRGDGGRYSPAANSWTALPASDQPSPRFLHTAVWTGTEMILWGGWNGSSAEDSGARYNRAANTWTALPATGQPRSYHTAVWTGNEMVVWGGYETDGTMLKSGALFHPAGNNWSAMTTTSAPLGRSGHTAIWTGNEMIVWGGYNGITYFSDGRRYQPASDTWKTLASFGAQCGGLQRLGGFLIGHADNGQLPQFLIDQRQQLIGRRRIARTNGVEQLRNVGHVPII